MSLLKIENRAISEISSVHQEYILTRFNLVIKRYSDEILEEKILNVIIKTLFSAGVKDSNDSKVITFLRENLLIDLKKPKYNHLTFEEFELAMYKGVRREYGIYMGVNIQTIHSWLNEFINSQERKNALKEFNQKLDSYKSEDKSLPPNPEGQKKVIEIYKQIQAKPINYTDKIVPKEIRKPIEKSERDIFIQKCFMEFYELWKKESVPSAVGKFINFNGKIIDEVEYCEMKLKELPTFKIIE